MLVGFSNRYKMKCFLDINIAEVVGFFNLSSEVVDIWQFSCILEGLVIKGTEVPTRPLGPIRLVLKVEGGTVELRVISINFFNDP